MAQPCSGFLNARQAPPVQLFGNAFADPVQYLLAVGDWYLKQWMETLRVSQAELVRRTDYPKAKVSNLATGVQRYNREVLNDMAKALNIAPFELLMHPDDAMANRRMRKAAEEMIRVPVMDVTAGEPAAGEDRKTA